MAIQAVIFDMDGVLIDSEIVYMRRLKEFMKHDLLVDVPERQLITMVGATGTGHWDAVKAFCPDDWNFTVFKERYRTYGQARPISYEKLLFPETLPTLKWLASHGYRIALATSTPSQKAMEVKEACGFGEYMEFILCGDMFKESKPNPEIYLKCLEKLGLPAEKCLVAEDSAYGIKAARQAGILVAARLETRYDMDQSGADYYMKNLSELPEILQR